MPNVGNLLAVVETPGFLREAAAAGMTEVDRAALVHSLAGAPNAGVSLGGGLYKIRVARTGSGKRGGWRVLYFFRRPTLPIFMLTVFGKNENANISAAEEMALKALCDRIDEAYGKRI